MLRQKSLLLAAIGAALSVGGTVVAAAAPAEYKIREGFTFRGDDGVVRVGGETIALAPDVAQMHLHKLEPVVQEEPAATEQPKTGRTRQPKSQAGAGAGNPPPAGNGDTGSGNPPVGNGDTGSGNPPVGNGDTGSGNLPAGNGDTGTGAGTIESDTGGQSAPLDTAEGDAGSAELPEPQQ